jgi:hypothetical protein
MNKFFVSTLAVAALIAAATASHAVTLTYELLTPPSSGATTFTTGPGISGYQADPSMPGSTYDSTLSNYFAQPSLVHLSQTFTTPSEVFIGDDTTVAGTGVSNTSTYFDQAHSSLSFNFEVDTGNSISATAHEFTVDGYLQGGLGYGPTGAAYSNAKLILTSVTDDTPGYTSILSTPSTNPGDGLPSLELDTTINGQAVDIWVDTPLGKPFPGNPQIVLNGFMASGAVPEPGSVAMIVGMGISGGIFLRRRRRA